MSPWMRKLFFVYIARLICVQTPFDETSLADERIWKRRLPADIPLASQTLTVPLEPNGTAVPETPDLEINHTQLDIGISGESPILAGNGPLSMSAAVAMAPLLRSLQRHGRSKNIRSTCRADAVKASIGFDEFRHHRHNRDNVKEWHELARVLDRLFFWILFFMMTLSAIFILLYPKYTGNEDGWISTET